MLTGATGYVGSHAARTLCHDGRYQVLSLTRAAHPLFSSGKESLRHYREVLIPADGVSSSGLEGELRKFQPDAILHVAALASAARCEEAPHEARAANAEFTRFLADLARSTGAFLCYVSTDLVFDGAKAPARGFPEDATPAPRSVYAKTKYEGEEIIKTLKNQGGIVRSSLVYGPPIGAKRGTVGWLEEGLQKGAKVTLFEDEWRTPIFVADLVEALLKICESRISGVLHASGPERLSRVDFGRSFAEFFGYDQHLIEIRKQCDVPANPPRPEDVSLNHEFSAKKIGISFAAPAQAFERWGRG